LKNTSKIVLRRPSDKKISPSPATFAVAAVWWRMVEVIRAAVSVLNIRATDGAGYPGDVCFWSKRSERARLNSGTPRKPTWLL
jgi:hypothetical protein